MNPRGYLTASKAWDAERAGRLFNIDDWHALTPAQRENYAHAEGQHLRPFNDSLMAAVTLGTPLVLTQRLDAALVERLAKADAISLTPNGSGGMKITINFTDPDHAELLFNLLHEAMP